MADVTSLMPLSPGLIATRINITPLNKYTGRRFRAATRHNEGKSSRPSNLKGSDRSPESQQVISTKHSSSSQVREKKLVLAIFKGQ